MAVELKVPQVGESITEVVIGRWSVAEGGSVEKESPVVEIETDKVTLELPAPVAGAVTKILKKQGEEAKVGDVIGYMEEGSPGSGAAKADKPAAEKADKPDSKSSDAGERVMPAAQRLLAQHNLKAEQVPASGPGGRLLKEDVERYVEAQQQQRATEGPRGGESFATSGTQSSETSGATSSGGGASGAGASGGGRQEEGREGMEVGRRRVSYGRTVW